MANWNSYEAEDGITREQKLEIVRQVSRLDLSPEQKLEYLETLTRSGWDVLSHILGLPTATQTFHFDCEMPNNLHSVDDKQAYRCSNPQGQHTFCVNHQLKKCPVDDT